MVVEPACIRWYFWSIYYIPGRVLRVADRGEESDVAPTLFGETDILQKSTRLMTGYTDFGQC